MSERLAQLPRVAEHRHYHGVGHSEPMQPLWLVAAVQRVRRDVAAEYEAATAPGSPARPGGYTPARGP